MHYLLTGATGYLGKHVLARLLRCGHRVTVLVRPRGGRLHARVIDALRPLEDTIGTARGLPQIDVLAGDIGRPDCGLAAEAIAELGDTPPDGFIHCAGLTRFETHLADDIWHNNLVGTRHAHRLATRLGIARFHHLSTAFVAGDSERLFGPGDRDCGQAFNNPYEAAKHAAEGYLADAAASDTGPAISIYRPSIVVGGCPVGDTHAVSTVYTFVKALHFLRACCVRDARRQSPRLAQQGVVANPGHCHIPLRVAAEPAVSLDLVDIDDVIDGIMRGFDASDRFEVHHLTGQRVSLGELRDGICRALAVDGPQLVIGDSLTGAPRSRLETQFERMTQVYQPYLRRAARFPAPTAYTPRAVDPHALTRAYCAALDDHAASHATRGVGALALAVAGVHEPRDYFHALADGRVARHFLARHDFVDLRVEFRVRGDHPASAVLHISHGQARVVASHDAFASDCIYSLDGDLFMRIVAGRADLRSAFFAGKVRIEGNKELALKFGALLGMYYRDVDEHVIEEVAV